MTDFERDAIIVQFRHRDVQIHVEASINGYAQAWLREHQYRYRSRGPSREDHERKARGVARHAVCSILRDWVKAQVTAIETGVFSFETTFLGQIMLPSGVTVSQHVNTTKLLGEGGRAK